MLKNFCKCSGLALALALSAGFDDPSVQAKEPVPAAADTDSHLGTFVGATDKEFTMKDNDGQEHKHSLATDAKVTDPNGQPCKIADLKAGQKIRVTTKSGDTKVATKVECVV